MTILQDSFGRRFRYLRLSITDVCNFRCNYCLPDGYQCSSDEQPLSVDEIRHLVAAFARAGTKKVRITGGEPSVRSDLPEIIETVRATPGIEEVVLTTNGYRLADRVQTWKDAGLDRINLSIDSLDPRQFHAITGHDRLQELLDGIEAANAAGFQNTRINTVLLKQFNGDGLDTFLDWVRETPLTLRFIELMRTGDNADFFAQNHTRGEDIQTRLLNDGWQPLLRDASAGPAREFTHPEYAGRIGLIMPYSKDFCSSCNRLRVSATGKLHLCLFGEQGHDLRHLLQHDQSEALDAELQRLMPLKKETHYLEQDNTGATTHFAMLGG